MFTMSAEAKGGIACWRQCVSMPQRNRARAPRRGSGIWLTSWRLRKRRDRCLPALTRESGCSAWKRSTTTCAQRSPSAWEHEAGSGASGEATGHSAILAVHSEVALHLSIALCSFWTTRGYVSEGRQRLGTLLEETERCPAADLLARAAHVAGNLAYTQSDYPQAQIYFERAAAMHHALGNRASEAGALINLATITHTRNNYRDAGFSLSALWRSLKSWNIRTGLKSRLSALEMSCEISAIGMPLGICCTAP